LPSLLVLGGLVLEALLFLIMKEKINYDGVKFGKLTVLRDGEGLYEGKRKRRSVICKCECGNEKEILLRQIIKGNQKSCGCGIKSIPVEIGQKFNYWEVLEEFPDRFFKVRCECGKESNKKFSVLNTGMSKSCGCKTEKEYKINPLNLEEANRRNLGDWKIVEEISAERNEKQEIKRTVRVICKCGYEKITNYDNIGDSKSCFKCSVEKRKLSEEALLKTEPKRILRAKYQAMVLRCHNENHKSYNLYGAKGITVCDEWLNDFNTFYEWSINNGYEINKDLSIDRINPTKGYYPENCRYITMTENRLHVFGLTLEDVRFIKSDNFTDEDYDKYNCSKRVIKNIRLNKSFKDV
jgi:hypothetical protein